MEVGHEVLKQLLVEGPEVMWQLLNVEEMQLEVRHKVLKQLLVEWTEVMWQLLKMSVEGLTL